MALYRSDVVVRIHHSPYPRSPARKSEDAGASGEKLANVHAFVWAVMGESRAAEVEELLGQLIAAESIHF
jgi:hypothetical protein